MGAGGCWGCRCEVPLDEHGDHVEQTGIEGAEQYVYPCTNRDDDGDGYGPSTGQPVRDSYGEPF